MSEKKSLGADDLRSIGISATEIDTTATRDLRPEVLDDNGRIRIMPAAYWAGTTVEERGLFGNRTGIYGFPTVELVERLKEIIDGRPAIEIGAGNGVLAAALGIPATDNRQQDMPKYKLMYQLMATHVTVPYGENIVEMHASRAVRHYKPEVVIGCWVTHKWDPRHPERDGNEIGIDEADVMRNCRTFVLIGNEHIHRNSRIWDYKPVVEYPDYVYSRATNGSRDFIAVRSRGVSRR